MNLYKILIVSLILILIVLLGKLIILYMRIKEIKKWSKVFQQAEIERSKKRAEFNKSFQESAKSFEEHQRYIEQRMNRYKNNIER